MGGDHAPAVTVAGALAAARAGIPVLLVGNEVRLHAELGSQAAGLPIEVVPAADVIRMDEHASDVRRRPEASVNVAVRLVKEGRAAAAVSMGHSGATMAAALLGLGRLPGVDRPAILTMAPSQKGSIALLDVGANADVRPQYLQQWAVLATYYLRAVRGVSDPSVGLLSIGEEEGKGNALVLEAYALLKNTPGIRFHGNVEGRDIFRGTTDIVVTDGFTGNVVLKTAEGEAKVLFGWIKEALSSSPLAKIGALLVRPALRGVAAKLDPSEHGASVLLGVKGLAFIGHGSADARAVEMAVRRAAEARDSGLIERLQEFRLD
ncbi:phosphate acyltransferase PlsX [Deinobacterium chartae]|nr:phosphate acyltransferase PlsX [Deinobacterium chartae]